jgi:poly-gamma-glutamate synthesis protein (capsule biosynthesis protein)
MYFALLDAASGRLAQLGLSPMRMRRFRLERPPREDAEWLAAVLSRESARPVHCMADGRLRLQ